MFTPELENFCPYRVSLKCSRKPIYYTCHVQFSTQERTLLLVACDIRQKLQGCCAACESKSTFPAAFSLLSDLVFVNVYIIALSTRGGYHDSQTVTVTILHLQWICPSVLATCDYFLLLYFLIFFDSLYIYQPRASPPASPEPNACVCFPIELHQQLHHQQHY